jgi:hypothetical protein
LGALVFGNAERDDEGAVVAQQPHWPVSTSRKGRSRLLIIMQPPAASNLSAGHGLSLHVTGTICLASCIYNATSWTRADKGTSTCQVQTLRNMPLRSLFTTARKLSMSTLCDGHGRKERRHNTQALVNQYTLPVPSCWMVPSRPWRCLTPGSRALGQPWQHTP